MTDPADLTILEAAARIERRALSAVELVEATLARAAETEPVLHAYACVLAERALADAAALDAEAARGGPRGPLHGIPLGVKDNVHVRDAPLRAGSRALGEHVSAADAACVARLREAGAVIVGKTVTHEFAYAPERGDGPQTRNAWRPDHLSGGSSAGSAVATAARSAAGALGTDTAGSVRGPSAWNAVVGLKPTFDLVPRGGVIPLSASLDHVGPLARTVDDCAALFSALAGAGPAPRPAGPAGMRVGVDRDHFLGPGVDGEVRALVEAALGLLAELGAAVVEVSAAELEPAASVGLTIVLVEASEYHRRRLRADPEAYCPGNRALLALGERVPAVDYATARRARPHLRDAMHRLFRAERLDLLVTPVYPRPAGPVDAVAGLGIPDDLDLHALVRATIPANVTGQPALALPCGFTAAGLPVGLQLLGRPHAEATLFAAGAAYEAAAGWTERRPPRPVGSAA